MWNSLSARTKKVIEETVTSNLLYLRRTLSTLDLETIKIERMCFHCDYEGEYWYDGSWELPLPVIATSRRQSNIEQCNNSSNLALTPLAATPTKSYASTPQRLSSVAVSTPMETANTEVALTAPSKTVASTLWRCRRCRRLRCANYVHPRPTSKTTMALGTLQFLENRFATRQL
jgi:hypothetical protein